MSPSNMVAKARIANRIVARLLDTGLTILLYFITIFAFGLFLTPSLIEFASLSCILLYYLRDGFNQGAGFSKGNRGIVTVDKASLRPCTYYQSFIRNLFDGQSFLVAAQFALSTIFLFLAATLFVIDLFLVILSASGMRVGDLVARTRVINLFDQLPSRDNSTVTQPTP